MELNIWYLFRRVFISVSKRYQNGKNYKKYGLDTGTFVCLYSHCTVKLTVIVNKYFWLRRCSHRLTTKFVCWCTRVKLAASLERQATKSKNSER